MQIGNKFTSIGEHFITQLANLPHLKLSKILKLFFFVHILTGEEETTMSSTNEKRSEAGRKGGEAVSEDREHMSEIGKKGGEESHKNSSTNQGEH